MRELVLGLQCDGPTWPETASGAPWNVGSAVVGPLGFLEAVETATGLRGPEVAPVRRIAAMRAKLEAADGGRFWSRSLATDPWATARAVLRLRDELVECGWTRCAEPAWPVRLRDLAAADAVGPALPRGRSDRIAAACDRLRARPRLPWSAIRLVEPEVSLPAGLRRLLDAARACGPALEQVPCPAQASGDLGRLHRLLVAGESSTLGGDGSLAVLEADTEAMAADALAAWLGAGSEAEGLATVCVLGSPTGQLDAALSRMGLPRFARSAPSPSRAALQVLPLALAVRWAPFDPYRMLELLLLPDGPVPRDVGRELVRALGEMPGRGADAWAQACEAGRTSRRGRQLADGLEGAALERALRRDEEEWRFWVDGPGHDPDEGMPLAEAREACDRVARWAMRAGPGDPLRAAAAGAAVDVAAALGTLGSERVTRHLLSRMVDEAIGPGVADPAQVAQAAPWSAVHAPGAIWSAAPIVVWWAPAGEVPPCAASWTEAEAAALAGGGCALDGSAAPLAALAHAWRQPLLMARERLVLVLPATVGGSPCDGHPLMHELRPLLDRAPPGVVFRAEELLRGPAAVCGRLLDRVPAVPLALPAARREWAFKPHLVSRPDHSSATSMELLLGCRLAWLLKHPGRVRAGGQGSVPRGERLLGLLAHEAIRTLFAPGAPPDPARARAEAERVLEELVPAQGAPLLLPGAAADLGRARERIPRAVADLAHLIRHAGLSVVSTELELEVPGPGGTTLAARLDMLLEDESGRRAVIDLKWQGRDVYRRRELEEGRAIQLAAYAATQPAASRATAAYYMLAQSRMLPADPWPFGGEVGGADLGATWAEAARGWEEGVGRVLAGEADAPGIGDGPRQHPCSLELEPPCGLCELGVLCGKRVLL